MDLKERLRKKGWTDEEIQKTFEIMYSKEKIAENVEYSASSNLLLYWSALIIAIIGNVVMSVALIPLLISVKGVLLYLIIATLGLVFGILIAVLLRDIEHLDYKHHIVAGLFIPALAIINVYLMATFSNQIANSFSGEALLQQNPVIISLIYVVSFILPYVVYRAVDFMKERQVVKIERKQEA